MSPYFKKTFFLVVASFFIALSLTNHTSAAGVKTITRGEPVTVGWGVTKDQICTPTTNYPSNAGDGVYTKWTTLAGISPSGSIDLPPVYNVGTFTFTCSYLLTNRSDAATLSVIDCPNGKAWDVNQCKLALKVGTLTYSPSVGPDVDYGETALLSWSGVEQATSCSLSGGSFSNINVGTANTGTRVTTTLTGDTTFTLTCQGPGGPISKSVTVPVAAGTISASPTVCVIPAGLSTCSTNVTWVTNNMSSPRVTDKNGVVLSTNANGSNVPFTVSYGNSQFSIKNGSVSHDSVTVNASCEADSVWTGGICVSNTPPIIISGTSTGSISINPVSCIIPSGLNSCGTTVTWSSVGLTTPEVLQGSTLISTNPSGTNIPVSVTFGNTTFYLNDATSSITYDSVIMAATCEFGSSWNGYVCLGASGTINSASCVIPTGESGCAMSVTWNATDATSPVTVTRAYDSNSLYASGDTGNQSAVFPNGTWQLDLRHGGSVIASGNFSSTCENGSLWDGSICALSGISGDLQVSSNECTIPVGYSSCPVSATWTTTGTSDPSLINQFSTVLSRLAQRISSFPVTVSYPSTTFVLREGVIPLDQEKVTARCSIGTWSNSIGQCVNPLVVSAVVTGQYYSNPGTITLTCSASNAYKVEKDGTLFASGLYALVPKNISVSSSGNYSLTCIKNDVSSAPVVRYYSSGPPPSPTVILTASPRTIPRDSRTSITWSILHPDNSCNLEARTICPRTGCSQDQVDAKNLINQKIATENIEQGSIFESSRSIRDSLRKIPTSRINTDWKTVGSKKFNMKYSTEFVATCAGGVSQAVRIQVTTTGEQ